jgi:SP family general alpha glucoside:H+ symporter-like MFS transporter
MGKAEEDVDFGIVNNISTDDVALKEIGDEARRATDIEHKMTFREGLRQYSIAIGWSAFFSLGIIMTAFDPQLLGSLYATPAFQKQYGKFINTH